MSEIVKVNRNLIWAQNAIETIYAHNKSAGTVAPGDVVILDTADSTATEIAFTTTATADDKLILGMVLENMADNGYGLVQTKGPTAILKVNGTSDIAVGDLLATYAEAKIAGEATTGKGGVFAIALEAFATDASTGVIDAYLMGGAGRFDTAASTSTYASPTFTGAITNAGDMTLSTSYTFTIAGAASATDALILTLGDILISDGHLDVIEANGVTSVVSINHETGIMASNLATLFIDDGGNIASGGNMLRLVPTGTPDAASILFEIVANGKIGQAIYVDGDPTGIDLVHFEVGGNQTDGYAVLGLTNAAASTMGDGSALLHLTTAGTPHTGAMAIEIDAPDDCRAIFVDCDCSTNHGIEFSGDGAIANDKAMLNVNSTKATSTSGASLVRLDGAFSTASGTVYGMTINLTGTNTEALLVEAGKSYFTEDVKIGSDSAAKLYFRDAGIYLYSSTNGQLDIISDGAVHFHATSAGFDVKFWGATSDYLLWDASDNALLLVSTPSGAAHIKAVNIAVTDSTTTNSGYNAAFFYEDTCTGAMTPTEYSGARFNLLLDTGTKTGLYNALKAKVGTGAAPTLTGATVYGFQVSMDEIGTTAGLAAIMAEMYTTTTIDASFYLWCRGQGSVDINSLIGVWGVRPTYFLRTQTSGDGGFMDAGTTAGDQCIGHMAIKWGATTGYINVFSDNS